MHNWLKRNGQGLVPAHRSRRVIHLDKRGRRQHSVPALCCEVLGGLCIVYCLGIGMAGFGTYFFLIWGFMGVAFIGTGALLRREGILDFIPGWARRLVLGILFLGLFLFGMVEGLILSQYNAQARDGADYLIVLGAQWKSTGPSEVLRRRLDKAADYLSRNPGTKVIVSGGQGGNEAITEASGMRAYLMDAGIDESRILLEDKSENTYENLVFSGAFLDRGTDNVVVVTNNFHMFRALGIARKQGYTHVEGLAAKSVLGMGPNNLLREFFGVVKDFFVGHL